MATSKLWAVHNNVSSTLSYVEDKEKTQASLSELVPNVTDGIKCEGGRLLAGINCDPATAVEEMNRIKEKFGKTDGVTAYHGYISFGPKDGLSPVDVLEVSRQIAKEMWGDRFQVLLGVHTNTGTLHCHFVVNSVSFVDGMKAADNEHNYYYMRNVVDRICKENNLSIVEPYSKPNIPDGDVAYAIALALSEGAGDVEKTAVELAKFGIKVVGEDKVRAPNGKTYYTTSFDDSFHVERPETKPAINSIGVGETPVLDLSNMGKPMAEEDKQIKPVGGKTASTNVSGSKHDIAHGRDLGSEEVQPSVSESEPGITDDASDDLLKSGLNP